MSLPNEMLEEVFCEAAELRLDRCLRAKHLDPQAVRDFLISTGGWLFGSIVQAALVGNEEGVNDVDFLLPGDRTNDEVRQGVRRMTDLPPCVPTHELEIACHPRQVCSTCGPAHGDLDLFSYHQTFSWNHKLESPAVQLDFVRSLDPQKLLACAASEFERIYHDGRRFAMPPEFCYRTLALAPTFTLVGFDRSFCFEALYDPWSFFCECSFRDPGMRNTPPATGQVDYPSVADKQFAKLDAMRQDILQRLDRSPETPLQDAPHRLLPFRLPTWLSRETLARASPEELVMRVVGLRYRGPRAQLPPPPTPHPSIPQAFRVHPSDYSVTRGLLRVLKMESRGIRCLNLDEYFCADDAALQKLYAC